MRNQFPKTLLWTKLVKSLLFQSRGCRFKPGWEYYSKDRIQKEKDFNKQQKINQIKELNIDFKTKTWGPKVAKLLNCSPQYALKFVKHNFGPITQ